MSELVQIMAWRLIGDKPISEPMMGGLAYWLIYASLCLDIANSFLVSKGRYRNSPNQVQYCEFTHVKTNDNFSSSFRYICIYIKIHHSFEISFRRGIVFQKH